jgi:hypothetical protein
MIEVFNFQQTWGNPYMSSGTRGHTARRVGAAQAATQFLLPPVLLLLSILSVRQGEYLQVLILSFFANF